MPEQQNEDKNIGGRPVKYKPEMNDLGYKLCLLGCTDQQLADFFEVNASTINAWKKDYPDFGEALKEGKIKADAQVAATLFKRAMGYEYSEETFEKIDSKEVLDITSNEALTQPAYKKKIVTKHLPGDIGAIVMWLKNRQRDLWKDKHDIGLEFDRMTDEQLEALVEKLKQSIKD
jgi:hypothetical protein